MVAIKLSARPTPEPPSPSFIVVAYAIQALMSTAMAAARKVESKINAYRRHLLPTAHTIEAGRAEGLVSCGETFHKGCA